MNSLCVCDAYGMCPQGCPHCDVCSGTGEAAGRLLQAIFTAPEHDGPPYTHTLKLPETEEEMAAEPPPSFTVDPG